MVNLAKEQRHPSGIVVRDVECGAPSSRKSSREVGGRGERWEGPDHPHGVLPQNWGGTEQIRTVTCMVLKTKANDRQKNIALSHDEFRGP
ncbi:hypothetical protein TNCV_4830621 [Trichonephila clavipes]|nr:hypothetical protein TNCV_4830621 [Trichonephila clavipes]